MGSEFVAMAMEIVRENRNSLFQSLIFLCPGLSILKFITIYVIEKHLAFS